MYRIIVMIVVAALIPMQVFAVDFSGFSKGTSTEYVVPRVPDKTPEPLDQVLVERPLSQPPKAPVGEKSATNWWLWGGVGLAIIVGSALAFSGGGGGSSSSGPPPSTTTVTGSW